MEKKRVFTLMVEFPLQSIVLPGVTAQLEWRCGEHLMPFTHCVDAPCVHDSWYPPGSSNSLLGAAGSPWLLAAEVALEVRQKCPEGRQVLCGERMDNGTS